MQYFIKRWNDATNTTRELPDHVKDRFKDLYKQTALRSSEKALFSANARGTKLPFSYNLH